MIGHHRALTIMLALHASRSSSAAEVDPEEHQTFADELTPLLYTNPNECSSALGVSMAFSLVYPGSTNNGTDQIRETLGYPGGGNDKLVWEKVTERMLESAGGQCVGDEWNGVCNSEAPLLKIANSVWFDDGDNLNEDYAWVVGDYAMQTNFSADESPIIVNEWVINSTNGMIDSIVPEDKPLFPPYVLLAINSIYLKARWAEQFSESLTNLDKFYESSSRSSEVSDAHFMHAVEYFDYSHEALPGYQVIDLPFAASKMSMIFVLPMTDGAGAVTSTDLIEAFYDLESTRMALSLPKFKFESQYEDILKSALMQTGIVAPFTEGTESLCGIFENEEYCSTLVIDKFIQKTVIDVNEKGVEAAAVTAAMAMPTSIGPTDTNVPILMILDHPFQFFIYDKDEELVLFEGRLGAPEVPETEPAVAQYDVSHTDDTFWSSIWGVGPVEAPSPVTTTTTSTGSTTSSEVESTSTPPAVVVVAASVNATEHQEFADELTTLLFKKDNECSSALGVSMAFSLIYPGCVGDAIEQVRETLRYPDGTNMQLVWETTTQEMLDSASGACLWGESDEGCESQAPLLKIANSVWVHNEYDLNPEYKLVVGDYVKQIDFKADNSPVIVNEWVKNSTNGMIDSIVPEDEPLFPPTVLLAINSIYLKAAWAEQFQYSMTNQDSFYESAARSSEVSKAHFMHMVEYFDYSHEALPDFQVIDLPFAESQMSMIFVLPMTDVAGVVSSTDLISAMSDLKSTRMALSLPKFKFESEYSDVLKDSLIQLGIEAPFTEGTGALCGLFEDQEGCEKLIIDEVIQKTVIDVNEKGVEAAAVTAISVGLTSAGPPPDEPILMILDHPFQFFIYDKSQDLMLFEGRLGKPEIPEIEPAGALLDAVHSADGFWPDAFGANPIKPTDDVSTTSSTEVTAASSTTTSEAENVASGSSTTESTEASGPSTSQATAASGSGSSTSEPTEASGPSTSQATTVSSSGSSTSEPTEASGPSTSQATTVSSSGSSTSEPTEASGLSTSLATAASGSGSSTSEPTEASGPSTSQATTASDSGSSTTEATEASSGAPTSQPTTSSQPTVASGSSTPQPTMRPSDPSVPDASKTIDDPTSGTVSANKSSSVLTGILLAFALVYVW